MTSRARRRSALAPLLLAATLTLTACGSDDIDTVGSAAGSAPEEAAPGTGAAGSAAAPQSSEAGDAGSAHSGGHSGGVPDVTANAKDLKKEPVLAAGTGTPPEKVVTKDLVVGKGETAKASATVTVQYVGALYSDGSVFDSSWASGPIPFALSGVVPGFAEGIVGMKVGGRREIVIPSALGYGPAAQPGIPANSTLVFIVDLIELKQ